MAQATAQAQAQARTTTATFTESMLDQAQKMGNEAMKLGSDLFFAGLGVVATTQERTRATFSQLVDKGKTYEKDDKRFITRAAHEVRDLGGRIEQQVQRTVTFTLHRAGVPSRDEIRHLTERVETLTRKVEAMASK